LHKTNALFNFALVSADVNWGASTQAQTYNTTLAAVQSLNNIEDHVKNYRPQILVLSGHPANRPALVDFANLVTKRLSLLMCGCVSPVRTSCFCAKMNFALFCFGSDYAAPRQYFLDVLKIDFMIL
jgi:hypothetical protein